ncbi:MAG: ubiquinol-cytochrome c reductase iron-sulfur subunit [Dongiaceae bacterium]
MAERTEAAGAPGGRGHDDGETRRDFLYLATAAVGGVGVAAVLWPFIDQMNPAADVLALASTEIDLSAVEVGQRITVVWRGKPVFIDRRTPEHIEQARNVDLGALPDPQADEERVQRPEWLVVVGICTHLGCIPQGQKVGDPRGEFGGWFCTCHGSQYDFSGRIRKGPAPRNLEVPPYEFVEDSLIRIG